MLGRCGHKVPMGAMAFRLARVWSHLTLAPDLQHKRMLNCRSRLTRLLNARWIFLFAPSHKHCQRPRKVSQQDPMKAMQSGDYELHCFMWATHLAISYIAMCMTA